MKNFCLRSILGDIMQQNSRLFLLLFFIFSAFNPVHAQDATVDADNILALAQAGQVIDLSKISVLQKIPMPQGLRNFLNKLVIIKPQTVKENAQNFGLLLGGTTSLQTILGGVVVDGLSVEVKIRIFEGGAGKKISVLVGLPSGFQLISLDSKLGALNSLPFSKIAIAYAADRYVEAEWGLQMDPGVNFLADIKTEGEVGGLLRRLGKNMDRIRVSGTITQTITGSKFAVGLGGDVTLGSNGQIGKASGLQFVIFILDVGVSIAVQSTINVKVPGQVNTIALTGEFKYTPPSLLSMAGYMEKGSFYGPPAFGLGGLAIGEFGIQTGVDVAEVAATAGLVPFQELGLAGSVMLRDKKMNLAGKINFGVNPDLLLIGELDNLFLQDIISFGATIIDRVSGRALNLESVANAKLPPIGIKHAKLYVVPRDTIFLGTSYQKGIEFDAVMQIVKSEEGIAVRVDDTGIKGLAYLKGLSIGPVKVTAGLNPKPGTPPDAAMMLLTIDPAKLTAQLYIDGGLEIDVLDGIKGATTIDIGTEGISAELTADVLKEFSATVRVSGKGSFSPIAATAAGKNTGDLSNDSNFGLYVRFQQSALQKLGDIIMQSAKEFGTYEKDVAAIKTKKDDLQRQIDKNTAEIARKTEENKQKLRNAQTALSNLETEMKNLNDAIARCKGEKSVIGQAPAGAISGGHGPAVTPTGTTTFTLPPDYLKGIPTTPAPAPTPTPEPVDPRYAPVTIKICSRTYELWNARSIGQTTQVSNANDDSPAGELYNNMVFKEDYNAQTLTSWAVQSLGCTAQPPADLIDVVYYEEYRDVVKTGGKFTLGGTKPAKEKTGNRCYFKLSNKQVENCK